MLMAGFLGFLDQAARSIMQGALAAIGFLRA
jgi:hypothetical protein